MNGQLVAPSIADEFAFDTHQCEFALASCLVGDAFDGGVHGFLDYDFWCVSWFALVACRIALRPFSTAV